jgi:TusE/DsrC/DsvC family sulfur relay protein
VSPENKMETPRNDATLSTVVQKLDALGTHVAFLVERQQKQQELIDDLLLPISKEFMRTATERFDGLEKAGWFTFGRELANVASRIVESYSAEDVRALGEAMTGILDTVRAMTQPEVLSVAGDISQVLATADTAEPMGVVGMVKATRDHDVQRGMAVMMEVLRHVGRGAAALHSREARTDSQKAKLAAMLGSRKRALGTERPKPASAPGPVLRAKKPEELPAPAGCAVPATRKAAVATVIDGVSFGADGHLVDATQWTKALAETLAAAQGVTLTPQHWAIVEFARSDFEATKAAPNVRRLTQGSGLSTKDIYALFPKAPGRTIARIAGLPKPAGCL